MTTAETRASIRPAISPLRGQRLRELIASSPMDARLVVPALALAAACGPQSDWEEPELVSRACDTKDPIQLSSRAGSAYGIETIGDVWAVGSGRKIDESHLTFDTIVVDPCGGGDIELLERSFVRAVGDGYLRCGPDDAVAWIDELGSAPVSLPLSDHCMAAVDSEHGVIIDDIDGRLLLVAAPQSEPRVIATDVAFVADPAAPDPLWAIAGDLVWYVDTDGVLARVDVVTGERVVLADHVEALDMTPTGDAVVWTRDEGDSIPGTTSIHRVATGEVIEVEGNQIGLWPSLVFVSTTTTTTVFDVASGATTVLRSLRGMQIVRADPGSPSMLVLTPSTSHAFQYSVRRVDLAEDRATYIADIHIASQVAIDPHGDGVLVTEVYGGDDEGSHDRLRLHKISRSGDARVVVENITYGYAVSSDGRVLYTPMLDDQTPSTDVRVRNPDGSDRVFLRDAWLVAPIMWRWPYVSNAELVDLEGDVLVNRRDGDQATLWRMPFDPDG